MDASRTDLVEAGCGEERFAELDEGIGWCAGQVLRDGEQGARTMRGSLGGHGSDVDGGVVARDQLAVVEHAEMKSGDTAGVAARRIAAPRRSSSTGRSKSGVSTGS